MAAIWRHGWAWFHASSQPDERRSFWASASKRGNKYLRKLLIHGARAALPYVVERDTPLGARAALPYVVERDTPLGRWAKSLLSRAHPNVVVVAAVSPGDESVTDPEA